MDPLTLANAAVALLVPLLKRAVGAGEDALTERVAGDAGSAVGRLYDRIKRRLAGKTYDENLLAGVADEPDDALRQKTLAAHLAAIFEREPGLADEIRSLVEDAQKAGAVTVSATDSGITAGGDVTITAGGDVAGRDMGDRGDRR